MVSVSLPVGPVVQPTMTHTRRRRGLMLTLLVLKNWMYCTQLSTQELFSEGTTVIERSSVVLVGAPLCKPTHKSFSCTIRLYRLDSDLIIGSACGSDKIKLSSATIWDERIRPWISIYKVVQTHAHFSTSIKTMIQVAV